MKKIMPQEIEVWYLIPALRRELSKVLVGENGLTQKKTSNILGVTEAAISQYLKSKRGKEVKFSKKECSEIKKAAKRISDDPNSSMDALYDLCKMFRGSKSLCDIHKKMDRTVKKDVIFVLRTRE